MNVVTMMLIGDADHTPEQRYGSASRAAHAVPARVPTIGGSRLERVVIASVARFHTNADKT